VIRILINQSLSQQKNSAFAPDPTIWIAMPRCKKHPSGICHAPKARCERYNSSSLPAALPGAAPSSPNRHIRFAADAKRSVFSGPPIIRVLFFFPPQDSLLIILANINPDIYQQILNGTSVNPRFWLFFDCLTHISQTQPAGPAAAS